MDDAEDGDAKRQDIAGYDEHEDGDKRSIAPGWQNSVEPVIFQCAYREVGERDNQANGKAPLDVKRVQQHDVNAQPDHHETVPVAFKAADTTPDARQRN